MYQHDPWPGATAGTRGPNLTREPLGTEGEMTAGPDNLRPSVPEERRELEDRGFLSRPDQGDKREEVDDFGFFGPPTTEEREESIAPVMGFMAGDTVQDDAEELEDEITGFNLFRVL